MNVWTKLAGACLLNASLGILGAGAAGAQAAEPALSTSETLCDYCADYTDKATSAGVVASSYRPGLGYASAPATQSVALQQVPAPSRPKTN